MVNHRFDDSPNVSPRTCPVIAHTPDPIRIDVRALIEAASDTLPFAPAGFVDYPIGDW